MNLKKILFTYRLKNIVSMHWFILYGYNNCNVTRKLLTFTLLCCLHYCDYGAVIDKL